MYKKSVLHLQSYFFCWLDLLLFFTIPRRCLRRLAIHDFILRRHKNHTGGGFCSHIRMVVTARFLWRSEAAPHRSLKWRVTYRIVVHTTPDRFTCRHESSPLRYTGDFGAFSVMERCCAARISKVESHISDRCLYYTGELFVSARKAVRYSMNIALVVETLRVTRLPYSHSQMNNWDCVRKKNGDRLRWCYTGRFATTIFSTTQRCNVTTMF